MNPIQPAGRPCEMDRASFTCDSGDLDLTCAQHRQYRTIIDLIVETTIPSICGSSVDLVSFQNLCFIQKTFLSTSLPRASQPISQRLTKCIRPTSTSVSSSVSSLRPRPRHRLLLSRALDFERDQIQAHPVSCAFTSSLRQTMILREPHLPFLPAGDLK